MTTISVEGLLAAALLRGAPLDAATAERLCAPLESLNARLARLADALPPFAAPLPVELPAGVERDA